MQSIQNVSRNSGLFSTVGTFSLIYLSVGWIDVELGILSPSNHTTSSSCGAFYCQQACFQPYIGWRRSQLSAVYKPLSSHFSHHFNPSVSALTKMNPLHRLLHTECILYEDTLCYSSTTALWNNVCCFSQPIHTTPSHTEHITLNIFCLSVFLCCLLKTPLSRRLWLYSLCGCVRVRE